jgi:hypothetical protein
MWTASQTHHASRPANVRSTDHRHRAAPADRRERALVAVAEGLERLAGARVEHVRRRVPSHLHRALRDLRHALRPVDDRDVADGEDVRDAVDRERRLDPDPARSARSGARASGATGLARMPAAQITVSASTVPTPATSTRRDRRDRPPFRRTSTPSASRSRRARSRSDGG